MSLTCIGVGVMYGGHRNGWQSPDLPAPAVLAWQHGHQDGVGWLLFERVPSVRRVCIGVGTNAFEGKPWQSPDLPAPTILKDHDRHTCGLLLFAVIEEGACAA